MAPIPLLLAVFGVRGRGAFGLGALAGVVGSLSLFGYMVGLGGPIDAVLISLLRAAQWGGFALAARVAFHGLPAWCGVFVLPALMAGFDALTAAVSPHGSAGSVAYSQLDFLPVVQLASLGGAPAITFMLGLVASTLAYGIALRGRSWRAVIAPTLAIVLAFGFGAWRLAGPTGPTGPTEPTGAPIALLATDRFERIPEEWQEVWSAYLPAIVDATADGAEIVVLPEKIFQIREAEAAEFRDSAATTARTLGVDLVIGVDERESVTLNRMCVFSSDGGSAHYDKQHLIPGGESQFTPGTETVTVPVAGAMAGLAICKDMDFPATIRGLAANADVMIVPAWDFHNDDWFHSRLAVLRGVENGVPVARTARDGLMTFSDAHGRIVAEAPSGQPGDPDAVGTLIAVPPRPTSTLYSRTGETFGWAMLAFAAGAVAIAAARDRGRVIRGDDPLTATEDQGTTTTLPAARPSPR